MASVQELIAAAQAQQKFSPLANLLENFAGGVNQGYSSEGADFVSKILQLRQQKEQQSEQAKAQRQKTLDIYNEKIKKDGGTIELETDPKTGVQKQKITIESKGGFLTPDQSSALLSGDPLKLVSAFPEGINQATIKLFNDTLTASGKAAKNAAALNLTPGQKAVDSSFANKEYVPFVLAGGFSNVEKNLNALNLVANELEKGSKNISGPVVGIIKNIPIVGPLFAGNAIDAQETIAGVIQQSLRQILGGQFAEKEGEQLVSRAFNPSLDEKTNARRTKEVIKQIYAAGKAKEAAAKYYEENGTLSGYNGLDAKTLITSLASQYAAEDASNGVNLPQGQGTVENQSGGVVIKSIRAR